MMDSNPMDTYRVPKSLDILSGIFLIFGGLCGLIVLADIVWRRGWRSMMWIMIPTYPITATYTGPVGMYLYFVYGRAKDPRGVKDAATDHTGHESHGHDHSHPVPANGEHTVPDHTEHMHAPDPEKDVEASRSHQHTAQKHEMSMHDIHMHDMGGPPRPLWATVLIGVSHCGAGCVIGDLVGEWLVFGTGITINGHDLWPCLLLDYAFALLFGIIFQYFSIAPMSGEYGLKTVVRAAKADILSLTAFEIGLFGWMVAYQAGIWNYRLDMNTWLYWWLMQVGMFIGAATAAPMNWWLITRNIKEPCA